MAKKAKGGDCYQAAGRLALEFIRGKFPKAELVHGVALNSLYIFFISGGMFSLSLDSAINVVSLITIFIHRHTSSIYMRTRFTIWLFW